MAYTTINKSTDYFNTKLYTGTGSSNAITGVGFQPDLLWIKSRSNTYSHSWTDAVRGKDNKIASNNSNAQYTDSGQLASFDSDGFTLNTDAGVNNNNSTYASWNWKANGQGSSNTDGSITSTVSANTTSGFSIGTYTSDITSAGYKTVGHGLGKKPKIIITKNLGVAGQRWGVQAPEILTGDSYILELNATSAEDNQSGNGSLATVNSNVFSVNWAEGLGNANSGGNYVFYAFTDIKGYSAMGSYTGNGNTDGTFIYTGFKPAFIIAKKYGATGDWILWDNKRDGYNETLKRVYPNLSTAEESSTAYGVDILSNGFKLRGTASNLWNGGNDTYIYMAFAEAPLVGNNNVPCTAR